MSIDIVTRFRISPWPIITPNTTTETYRNSLQLISLSIMFARSLRSAVARPLSASTSTTSTASSRTTLLAASRRWNSTSSEDKKSAENVKDAADKVDSAAEEVAKKVQELEAQVKELKVSSSGDLSFNHASSNCVPFHFVTVRTHLRKSRLHQPSKKIRDRKDHCTRIRHPEIRSRPLTHRRHPFHRLEIRPSTYPCREHRPHRLVLWGPDDESRVVENVDEARSGRV